MNKPARLLVCILLLSAWIVPASAQMAAFNFNYPGPNVLALGPDCTTTLEPQMGDPTVTSEVGANIITSEFDSIASGFGLWTSGWNLGEVAEIHWYVEDDMGNSHTFLIYITFADLTGPMYDVMGVPTLIEVNSVFQVPPIPNIPLVDNCTPFNLLDTSFLETPYPDTCESGTITRTWMATDTSGNSSVFTQTINVYADTLPPQILVSPLDITVSCENADSLYLDWITQQMDDFDAVDASPITYTNDGPALYPSGCATSVTVIFTATDLCGLKSTREATFTTADLDPPVVTTVPLDSVAYCSFGGNEVDALADWINREARMAYFDACSDLDEQTVTMYINGNLRDSAEVVSAFLNSFSDGCGPQMIGGTMYDKVRGSVTVDFFVTDPCDSTTYAGKATYAAIDTLPPNILGDSLHTEQCNSMNQQVLENWIENFGAATLDDDCSGATFTDFSWTDSNGQMGSGNFGSGPYPQVEANNCTWFVQVNFRATDECGNIGNRTLGFQIFDDIVPSFANYDTTTIYCPEPFPTVFAGTVTDNCDPAPTVTFSYAFSDTVCVGNYTLSVTWTATDSCGNQDSVVQTFLVRDTVAPAFDLLPAGFDAGCDSWQTLTLPIAGVDVTATDVCGLLDSIAVTEQSNQDPDMGVCGHYDFNLTRVFTAVDVCGNSATATQVVHVRDSLGPDFTGYLDTTSVCDVTPMFDPPTLSDNCSGVDSGPTLDSEVITPGLCTGDYTITYTWSAIDVCGNVNTFSQDVHVLDTVAPTLTGTPANISVECDAIPDPPSFSIFTKNDNCADSSDVSISFAQSEIRDPDPMSCAHWTNYIIVREWTATDDCGNARTFTQHINVQDNTGPILSMPDPQNLPSDTDLCGINLIPPAPLSIYDVCTSQPSSVILTDTMPLLTESGMPSATEPVDTMVFTWASPSNPPLEPVIDSVDITVSLINADAEGLNEFLRIYGEGGYLIGQTANSPSACNNSTATFRLPPELFNQWLTDGTLEIILEPNGVGVAAINPYCNGGGQASVTINYPIGNPQVDVDVTFTIDGGPVMNYPTVTPHFFDVGNHTIVYTATDCAGNFTVDSLEMTVMDVQAPQLSSTPPSEAYVGPASCDADVLLPFPNIIENCGLSGLFAGNSPETLLKFYLDDNAGVVPIPMTLTITGAVPNAVTGGTLRIRHLGDHGQTGEFFQVRDENAMNLGVTITNTGVPQCTDYQETIIPVSATDINNWAADGVIDFTLIANTDVLNFTDFINPCAPVQGDSTDGQSTIQVFLEYDYAIVDYWIREDVNGPIVNSGQLTGNMTEVNLPPGMYTVYYATMDAVGLVGNASYPLQVLDTISPFANCTNLTIFVNASGEVDYNLLPSEIDDGSFDNCSGSLVNLSTNPSVFTCDQEDQLIPVTLTVTDTSGNSSECIAQVRVEIAEFFPTYDIVCLGDTLNLYSNPPATPGGDGIFTYSWTGPMGWMSAQQNPVRLNSTNAMEGSYMVVVTGLTGCTATGNLEVDLIDLPDQPPIEGLDVCDGSDIFISTTGLSGSGVTYSWYTGTLGSPVLVAETNDPFLTIPAQPIGMYNYFVRVSTDGCTSMFSQVITVEVKEVPVATVNQDLFDLCECQALGLGTTVQGPDITYQWNGPNGFNSTLQFPPVNNCVSLVDSGLYTLIVNKDGCASLPDSVQVNITQGPPMPVISGAAGVCVGDSITLSVNNITGPAQFIWTDPDQNTQTTPVNMLTLDPIALQDSGMWRVQVVQNGCVSMQSVPVLVQVQPYPNVFAETNGPVCAGTTLQLNASATPFGLSVDYDWIGPGGYMSSQQNPTRLNANAGMAGQYIVTAMTSFQCSDSDTLIVGVIPIPVIDTVYHNAPLCSDGTISVQFFAETSSTFPIASYQWFGPMGWNSQSPSPIRPGATSDFNGEYNLTVIDSMNCISIVETVDLEIFDIPPTPIINPVIAVCEGTNVMLTLENAAAYQTGSYTFHWEMPNNQSMDTNDPFLDLPSATEVNDGFYTVQVMTANCNSLVSIPVELVVNQIPSTPNIFANENPICEGSVLELSVPLVANATYTWTGPNGFNPPSIHNPTIDSATVLNEGNYYCVITVNGCSSPQGEGLFVDVIPRPQAPVLKSINPVCMDQMDTLVLMTTAGSTTPDAMYHWYNIFNVELPGSPTVDPMYTLTDLMNLAPGLNGLYVVAEKDGCTSLQSTVQTVQVDTIPPNMAFAGLDKPACIGNPFELNATAPPPGSISGLWDQVSGPMNIMIVNPNAATTEANGHLAGNVYEFSWTLSNGACEDYSSDTIAINAVAFEEASVDTSFFSVCFADTIQLNANQGQNTTGAWSNDQPQFGLMIADSLDPNTIVTNLDYGQTYVFTWTLQDIGCGESSVDVSVRNIGSVAFAGLDQTICDEDSCTTLLAQPLPDGETGMWTSPNPSVLIASQTSETTQVCGLNVGDNLFFWETNEGICGDESRDTVVINYELTPIVNVDSILVPFGAKVSFDILLNDILPDQYAVLVVDEPSNGRLEITPAEGVYTYQPDIGFMGVDKMTYRVCNLNCVDACNVAQVVLIVEEAEECDVPTVITPNGDGVNDVFFVPCLNIDGALDNELSIFNQWGDEVFHAQPYDNNWSGTYNGEPLPAGTYYFVVKFNQGGGTRTGFLIIQY